MTDPYPYYAQMRSSLAAAMDDAIQQILPYHLRRPSEAQVNYAVGIAKALEIPVPPEVLSQRRAIHEFLDAHVPAYRRMQAFRFIEKVAPRSRRANRKVVPNLGPDQQGDT